MAISIEHNKFNDKKNGYASVWDNIALYFQCVDMHNSNYAPSIENYNNVWPVLYDIICSQLRVTKGIGYRVCDFGCGTGKLAQQLYRMKLHTFACDISKEMITRARLSTQKDIVYGVGSFEFVQNHSPFKLITAIMVFQFLEDFHSAINVFSKCLDEDGVLFFATHDIEYVKECIKCGVKFRGMECKKFPTKGEILIGDRWIETYIRSSEWYDNILSSKGFVRVGYSLKGAMPPLGISEENRKKWNGLKYYIAWYKKKS